MFLTAKSTLGTRVKKIISFVIIHAFLLSNVSFAFTSTQTDKDVLSPTLQVGTMPFSDAINKMVAQNQPTVEGEVTLEQIEAKAQALINNVDNHFISNIAMELANIDMHDMPDAIEHLITTYAVDLAQLSDSDKRLLYQYYEFQGDEIILEDMDMALNYYKQAIFFAKLAKAWIVKSDQMEWFHNISLVGGKIANSLELEEGNLEVPPFFGITSIFQKYVWLYNGFLGQMREIAFLVDPQDVVGTSFAEGQFKELISKSAMPRDLETMLEENLREIADTEGYALTREESEQTGKPILEFILRSSQGLEDRPGIPSAGIGESIPAMGLENLHAIFKPVAASAYIRKALIYRDKIAMFTWLMDRISYDELEHVVNLLEKRRGKVGKIKVADIDRDFNMILDELKENLDKEKRERKEFIYVSTIRIMALLNELRKSGIRDDVVVKMERELRKVRIDSLDPARVGGGIQGQIMRDSYISVIGFAVNKATGWTGATNKIRIVEYDTTFGRGEVLVQGTVIGDHYKIAINEDTGEAVILEKLCGSKMGKLKRGVSGKKYLVWKDTKMRESEEIVAKEGKEYLMVTTDEERHRFALTDAQAIEMAFRILKADYVHNIKKGENPIPVDMEACLYYDLQGKLNYSIVQKRDTTAKDGFDYEDSKNVKFSSTEPNPAQADAAQEQGNLVAKGFGTQNAASGVTVWVEEVSASRVNRVVDAIMDHGMLDEERISLFKTLIPKAHSELYSDEEIQDFLDAMIEDLKMVSSKVQDDFDVKGVTISEARVIQKIISNNEDIENALKALKIQLKDKIAASDIEKLSKGLTKLYRFRQGVENRLKLFATIISLNIFSKVKGDLRDAFVEEHTSFLEKNILDRQFQEVKRRVKEGKRIILVTPETNPNFNDIMQFVAQNGGATVTLQGGKSAHAVIIAIQFGYCVVGGTEFTKQELLDRIIDGEEIILTVDGNKGQVYDVEMDIVTFNSLNQVSRWGQYGGDIGLITNSEGEAEKFASVAQWQVPIDHRMYPYLKGKETTGYYAVSLDRIEEWYIEKGIASRTAFAYDRILKEEMGDKDIPSTIPFDHLQGPLDENTLKPSQKSDMQKLRAKPELRKEIQKQINEAGYVSAVDYLAYGLSRHFLGLVATTRPGQVVQVRQMDLKLREIYKTQKGAELFYRNEEASMIGFRGIGHEVDDENIEGLKIQIKAIDVAEQEAERLGKVGDLGFFFVFIRRLLADDQKNIPSDLQKALNEILKMRRNGDIKRIPKQIGAMFELTINALFAEELNKTLADFRNQVKEEFGEEIVTFISYGTNDLTQSILGSRDEGRYASIDFLMPSNKKITGYRVFYEGNKAVTDTLKHGAIVAKKYGNKVGLCGEALNNLINSGLPEDIDAAQDIIVLIDSGGTSVKVFPKTVKVRADTQLSKQSISDVVGKKANALISGEKLVAKGAAYRTAVFLRSEADFVREHIIWRDGKKRKDVTIISKAAEGDILIVSSKVDITNTYFLNMLDCRDGKASGVIIVNDGNNIQGLKDLLKEKNIPSMVVADNVFNVLEDLKKYVFDFARAEIYTKDNISFDIEKPVDDTAYVNINYNAQPKEMKLKIVKMDDVYKELNIHPLALVLYAYESGELENTVIGIANDGSEITKRDMIFSQHKIPLSRDKFKDMYKDVALLLEQYEADSVRDLIRKVFEKNLAQARSELAEDEELALQTSDADVWFFEGLRWGKTETELEMKAANGPIDLRGLAKTISAGYDEIFKMFLDVVETEKINIQFAYIQNEDILNFALRFLNEYGINEADKIKIGMTAATSHNFIVADEYYKTGKIDFVSFDRNKLLMNLALVNLDERTYIRRHDDSYEPLIDPSENNYQKALEKVEAMLKTAMVKYGVKLAVTDEYLAQRINGADKTLPTYDAITGKVDAEQLTDSLVAPAI